MCIKGHENFDYSSTIKNKWYNHSMTKSTNVNDSAATMIQLNMNEIAQKNLILQFA